MSFKLKLMPLAVAQVVASGALSMLAVSPVMAQQVSSDQSSDAQPVQRIEVTGSNIRRVDAETPSPVQVITATDLKNSGFTTIADVLNNITANGQGTLSNASYGSFAGGASGIALRGLNTASTLVLIDGHRMAPYPLSDNAQFAFVDISNIPFDAVERIEVLKDGSSAVYGSDAMAGVVNVILKKSFIGTKVSAEGGSTTEGGGATVHASVMHGVGDYDADGYNAYLSLEYRHQDPVSYADRAGDGLWSSTNLTSIGGNNKTPGVIGLNPNPITVAPYLLAPGAPTTSAYFAPGASCNTAQLNSAAGCAWQTPIDFQPETQNVNLLGSFTKKLQDGWQLDVKASLFDSQSLQVGSPAGGNGSSYPQSYIQGSFDGGLAISAGTPGHLVGIPSQAVTVGPNYPYLPAGVPNGVYNVYGLIPGAPAAQNNIESKTSRLVVDLKGTLGDWDIDTSIGYTKVGTSQDITGSLNTPALIAALNRPTNPFNIFGGNSAADIAAIFPESTAYDTSLLEFGEFHASRGLATLPGGDLGFSTGASFIHRDMEAPATLYAQEGLDSNNNAFASGAQNDAAAYLEFAAPVLKTLEVDVDARLDHFDTVGNARTGKLGFKWTPSDMFALRGTASNGFRAPNAAESGNSGTFGFASSTYDPVYCPGGPQANGNPPKGAVINLNGSNLCNYIPAELVVSNPTLQPERSTSFTLGAILEPVKGWSSTIDAYKITVRDQIVWPSLDYSTAVPVRSTTAASGTCSDGTATGTEACPGPIYPVAYYPVGFINANSTMTSGLELGTRYKFKLGDYGTLKAELDWTHVTSYVYTVGGVSYQLVGTHGPVVISNDTGNPRNREQITFTWDKGPWEVATVFNITGNYDLTDPSAGLTDCTTGAEYGNSWFSGTPPTSVCKVKAFVDTNLTARYVVNKQWSVHASVANLFNQAPPLDVGTYGSGYAAYSPALAQSGAIGRMVTVGAVYSF